MNTPDPLRKHGIFSSRLSLTPSLFFKPRDSRWYLQGQVHLSARVCSNKAWRRREKDASQTHQKREYVRSTYNRVMDRPVICLGLSSIVEGMNHSLVAVKVATRYGKSGKII